MKQNKKEALAAFHRATIIDVAEHLFLEKGVAATTMNEIAKTANYSKSTIYVYFKSKEDIYNRIVLNSMMLLKKQIRQVRTRYTTFIDQYYGLCQVMTEFQEQYPLYFRSLLSNIPLSGENDIEVTVTTGEEINEIIAEMLQNGIIAGELRPDIDCRQVIFTFWASISGIILLASDKAEYISHATGKSKTEFLKASFTILLNAIQKKGGKKDV